LCDAEKQLRRPERQSSDADNRCAGRNSEIHGLILLLRDLSSDWVLRLDHQDAETGYAPMTPNGMAEERKTLLSISVSQLTTN